MTEKKFTELCRLQQAGATVSVSYRQFNLTGRLAGYWEDSLVVEINGQFAVWPRELCGC